MAQATDKYAIQFDIVGINKLQKYQQGLKRTNNQLRELNKKIAKQKTATAAQANQLSRLTAQQQMYNAKVKSGIAGLRGNTKASKGLSKSMASMGMSVMAAVMAFRKLSSFLTSSIKDFAAYERGVKNVTTLLSSDDKNMFSPNLYRGVKDVSAEFGFTLADVNKAMFNSVSAGVSAGNAVNFLKEASMLAIAGVTDLKSAALGLTTVINAYGMGAEDANRVSEIFFTTQKFGVTTVEELSKSIGVVVPFAAASGIAFEELGAAIAVTTRSGLDAAKTVTALRAAISQMQKPTGQSIDLFTKWGIPIGAAEMKLVGFTETMRRLNEVYKQSPRDIELMFGNVRGLTAIFSIAGENAGEYSRFLKAMVEDTGELSSLQAALATNMESADIKLKRLDTSMKNLKVSIGSSKWMADLVTEMTNFFNVLSSENLSGWDKFLYDASYLIPGAQGEIIRNNLLMKETIAEIISESEALKSALLSDTKNLDTAYAKLFFGMKNLTFEEVKDVQAFLEGSQDAVFKDTDVRLNNYRKLFTEWNTDVTNEALRLEKEAQAAADLKTRQGREWRAHELDARGRFNDETYKANLAFAALDKKTDEDVKNHKLKLIQLELEYLEDILNQKGISAVKEVEIKKKINNLLLKETSAQVKREEKIDTKRLQVKAQLQTQALNAAAATADNALKTQQANEDRAMSRRAARLDQEAEDGLINQRELAKKKDELDKEAFQKKKEHDKKAAAISFIQELIAIRIAAAANPLNPVTFGAAGVSQYAIQAAIATAAFAGNIATINSQKFAQGGLVHGNSHAQGGERFAVGGRVAELEGGEAVINKRSTAMFGGALSAMNVAGGGKSFSSPNISGGGLIDYGALGAVIGRNTNVVLPVESLNKVQNRVKAIESSSKF